MSELIQTRRGFLLGGLAIVASPAIVRATSLMPVKCWKTYGPGGVLTMEMITEEMSKLLRPATRHVPADTYSLIRVGTQRHVDAQFSSTSRRLPLEDFSRQILSPIARVLAQDKTIINAPLLVHPNSVEEQARRDNVRGLSGYFIGTDSIITRFDVLTA